MTAGDYSIVVEPLEPADGGGFVAYAPDLCGRLSDGATPAEALENVYDAVRTWLETAERLGRAAPTPTRERRFA